MNGVLTPSIGGEEVELLERVIRIEGKIDRIHDLTEAQNGRIRENSQAIGSIKLKLAALAGGGGALIIVWTIITAVVNYVK